VDGRAFFRSLSKTRQRSTTLISRTSKRYFLGDEVFLLLTLPDSSERLPVAGKVIWVTPVGAQSARTAGIGVQFADTNEGEAIKGKIETLLAGTLNADKPTHTM